MLQASGEQLVLPFPVDTLSLVLDVFAIDDLEEKEQLRLSYELDEGLSASGGDATLPEFSKIEGTSDLMSQPY